ncbi:MAG: hypothetical protein JXL84_01665 [Deltaproteobacteria bacterium]|nr:hypothetical protein [Deltaproteobacteria bacterium]
MKKQDIKPFVWGMAVGSLMLLIVIFSAGWVVTSGSAEAQAKEIAASAVLDRLTPISVAQFMKDPNRQERLKELKAEEYYKRGEFVQKQGWATMPGEKEPDSFVADECARRLLELKM